MKKIVLFCCALLLLTASPSFSQVAVDSAEITSSVPELTSFHHIIYPIWHDAYPSKDIEALKGFVPQIKTYMEAVNAAKLPGILHEKEADWKIQLKELNTAAENYYAAAAASNGEALLAAAEELHHQYEMMVRVVRPVLAEMDAYHQLLYVIYHKMYPEKKYNDIAAVMDELIKRADDIVKCPKTDRLKRRLGENAEKFDGASQELYTATVSLKEALKGSDSGKKDEAVQKMHSSYQNLESLF